MTKRKEVTEMNKALFGYSGLQFNLLADLGVVYTTAMSNYVKICVTDGSI